MWDCPTREGKQIAPNVPKDYAPNKRHFYELRTTGEKPGECDDDCGNCLYFSL